MVVFEAGIFVEVEGLDAGAEELKGCVDGEGGGGVGGVGTEVGVTEVESDAYVVEVADAEDFEQVVGGGDFVREVFEEDLDAEGVGEGFEVLDGGEGVLEGAEVPGVVFEAEVEGDGGDGDLLGGFEGALDLVHGVDAAGFFGVDAVAGGWDVAGPERGGGAVDKDGLVQGGGGAGVAEPGGDIADDGAVGVVEVVAGGEELDGGVAMGGEAAKHRVEQAGVQALLEEDVRGEAGLHLN